MTTIRYIETLKKERGILMCRKENIRIEITRLLGA